MEQQQTVIAKGRPNGGGSWAHELYEFSWSETMRSFTINEPREIGGKQIALVPVRHLGAKHYTDDDFRVAAERALAVVEALNAPIATLHEVLSGGAA